MHDIFSGPPPGCGSDGNVRAVRTRDAVAQTRDGWPYFRANPRSTDSSGEALFEVQFGDGAWMLAVQGDLSL
ncbi:MAG: hypothetical protein JWN34_770 [Bryobacterales bacterium]|nr:hypothetical protein [Bryobacterales bacterium]